MFASFQFGIYVFLAVGAFAFEAWALIEALRYSNEEYYASGKRNKAFWTALTGAAAAVGFLGLPFGVGLTNVLGLLGLAAVVVAGIFMADVRPALQSVRGPSRKAPRGGW